jgi:hypothetical protein
VESDTRKSEREIGSNTNKKRDVSYKKKAKNEKKTQERRNSTNIYKEAE